MPKQFDVKTTILKDGKNYEHHVIETCRESWLILFREFYVNEIAEDASSIDMRSTCSLLLESGPYDRTDVLPIYLEEIKETWYPAMEYSFSEEKNLFTEEIQKSCVITDKGLLAMGAMWWVILIERLHEWAVYNNQNFEPTIQELLNITDTHLKRYWYNSTDQQKHLDLLKLFHRVRMPDLWIYACLEGPIKYIEYAEREFELPWAPFEQRKYWCEICNDYHDETIRNKEYVSSYILLED
jgi:hypothetical protein